MAHTEIAQPVVPATEGQMKEVVRLFEDAFPSRKQLEELATRYCFGKDNAQQLIERAGELKAVRKFFADLAKELSNTKLYADQVVKPNCGYLSGYRKARPMDEQIRILQGYAWGREIDWSLNKVQQKLLDGYVPQGSEGYFAVVFDPIMVTHYEEVFYPIDQSVPVTRVLSMLTQQRIGNVVNHCDGELGSSHYRRSKKSAEKMRQLWESQGCPTGIILIPAQLGLTYAGHSVLRSRVVIRGSEFPLDAYEVLQMVLTHKTRLEHCDDLLIDLPGSEYSSAAGGTLRCALRVGFNEDRLQFGYHGADGAFTYFGSASGFLPQ